MGDDNSSHYVPIFTHLKTQDVDELAEFYRSWDREYIQLKQGIFEWETSILQIGKFEFIEEFYGAPALLRGSSPPDTFSIGIPTLLKGKALYGGHIVSEGCCLTGNYTGLLDFRAGHHNRLLIIVAPMEKTLSRAEQMQWLITREQLLIPGIMTPNLIALGELSSYVTELMMLVKTYPHILTSSKASSTPLLILEDFLPLLLDLLTSPLDFVTEKNSSRRKLVKNGEKLMCDRLPDPITLTDLCRELKKSSRTIHYGFQECFGLPPMAYLKILRLHGVRRAFKSAAPQTKITDIALDWGFWHMGQFSIDYKKMFGESPKNTLKRWRS